MEHEDLAAAVRRILKECDEENLITPGPWFDGQNTGISLFTAEGKYITSNRANQRMTGRNRENSSKLTIFDTVLPKYHEGVHERLSKLEPFSDFQLEFINVVNQCRTPVSVSASIIELRSEGYFLGVQIPIPEITEEKIVYVDFGSIN